MGETLRVKAGEDAMKRVQQGFDKVAKEKQMNGSVLLLLLVISVECGLDCLVGGLRKADQARRTVSQHRLDTAQKYLGFSHFSSLSYHIYVMDGI